MKVPAFALRDKATNEYFTTVDDTKRAANEWSSTAAYAQQRREFAMRKERDFLLAVKALKAGGTPASRLSRELAKPIHRRLRSWLVLTAEPREQAINGTHWTDCRAEKAVHEVCLRQIGSFSLSDIDIGTYTTLNTTRPTHWTNGEHCH